MTAVATPEEAPRPHPPTGPRRVLAWIRDDPGAAVTLAASVLIVLQVALRGWAAAGGYFVLDDFVFIARARTEPFDAEHLFTDYNGHVMPGAFALVSALTELTPLSWPAVVGLSLVGQLAVDVALFRLLVLLFGRRPAVLLPLAVFLASSITLPAFVWWAAALNQLPMQLAVLLALDAHVRFLRGGRLRDAVHSVLAVAGGLLFSEKTILAVPLLVAVTLFWFAEGGPRERVTGALRRHRTAWLLHGGLALAYTVFYLTQVSSPILGGPSAREVVDLLVPSVFRSVLPGLLGGPWVWEGFPPTLALTAPPAALQWLSAVAVALVVAASVVLKRGAGRAWLLLAVYVAGTCLLLGASRAQLIGPWALAREYRYFTDVALVAALCLALAFLPVRDARVVLRERTRPAAAVAAQPVLRRAAHPVAGAAVVLALVAGSVVSTAGYTEHWWANPARPFVENARADLAARPGTVLIDGQVPDPVMWRVLGPYTLASSVLAGVGEAVFLQDGNSIGALRMLDETGRVQPAFVEPVAVTLPGPQPDCGWLVADRPVPIPLAGPVGPWRWVVRVTWLSAADNLGWVTVGDNRVPVLLPAGLHETFVQVSGAGDTVTVELQDPTRAVCIVTAEVGTPRVVPPAFR